MKKQAIYQRYALVTGSSSGIGKEIAQRLAEAGYIVFINFNKSFSDAEKLRKNILNKGQKAFIVQADVSNEMEIKRMFSEISKTTNHLDILINNAGIYIPEEIEIHSSVSWDQIFNTNLKGKFMPDDDRLRKYANALEISWEEMQKVKRKSELIEMGIHEENIFTDMLRIPLLGTVPCGSPQEAIEESGEFVPIPFEASLAKKTNLFALKANGLSMIEADIRPGDIIIIDPNSIITNGDIVVAMIENEATLKYYYERGGYVELKPANPDFKPIKTNDPSLRIIGKLILKATYQNY